MKGKNSFQIEAEWLTGSKVFIVLCEVCDALFNPLLNLLVKAFQSIIPKRFESISSNSSDKHFPIDIAGLQNDYSPSWARVSELKSALTHCVFFTSAFLTSFFCYQKFVKCK